MLAGSPIRLESKNATAHLQYDSQCIMFLDLYTMVCF